MEREETIHYLKTAPWKTARFGANVRFFRGDTLVRYIEIPWLEGMEDAVDWLCTEEGCAEVFVDGKRPDVAWKPLRAWYEDVGRGPERTWRLYHAMRNARDNAADGPYTVENGCVYKEEHTFFWRTAEVIEVPEGSSGVSYSLQGIRRDEENGLYSYVLVKRERVAVEVGPWLSHQDGYEDRKTALLLGLREEEESSVDDKVEAFAKANGMATEDGGGKVVDIQKSKNDDCTTDVTLVNVEEQPVPEASKTERVSALAKVTRKTDRNQAAPGVPSATPQQGKVETVTNEKTPGGLYDVTSESVESTAVDKGKADVACAKTIYEHEHRETARSQKTRGDEAEEAGSGKIHRKESRLNEDGTFDNSETETEERPVPEASKTERVSALAKVTRKTDRNQAAPGVPSATPQQGKVETVTNEKTPGGLYDVTSESIESAAVDKGKADVACAKTIYEHEHRETARNQKTREPEATDAGGGKTYRKESRLNEDGTFDNSETETEELEVEDAQKVEEEERFEKVASQTDANKPSGTALPAFIDGTVVRKELRKNPGGSVTESTTTRTAKEGTIQFSFKTDARGRTRHYAWFRNLTEAKYQALAANYTDGSVSINAFGLYDGTLGRVDAPDGSSGDFPSWNPYEKTFETQNVNTTYHKGNGTSSDPDGWYIAIETLTVVEGILNDNAAAAYAKVSGSLRPPRVTQLSSPTMQNKGWYSYSYVSNVTFKREFVPGDEASVSQAGTIS